uniref:E2/NS1 protein (cDNA 3) (Fragments) n=1 Tax=Hepacivirus hominis TaxID=3052230 RepID=Q7M015_9HEPC
SGVDATTRVTGGIASQYTSRIASLFNAGPQQKLQLVGWGPLTDANITGPSEDRPY